MGLSILSSFGFMRRALMAPGVVAQRRPLGVFLLPRRMSLVGDALSHAVLPGRGDRLSDLRHVAGGDGGGRFYRLVGGGDAVRPGDRRTPLKEDASFAVLSGVTGAGVRWSRCGSSVDLLHVLFGSILAVDAQAMLMVGAIARFRCWHWRRCTAR